MRFCRFGDGRVGLVEDSNVRDVTPALDVLPVYRYPLPPHDVFIANLDRVAERARAKTTKPHFSLIPASFIHQLRGKGICGYVWFRQVFFVGLPDELMLVTNGPPRIDHNESAFSMQVGVFLHHLWSKMQIALTGIPQPADVLAGFV